jgi:hypothetical protein
MHDSPCNYLQVNIKKPIKSSSPLEIKEQAPFNQLAQICTKSR